MNNPYATVHDRPVSELAVAARADFIVKTYLHLLGALTLFVGLEVLIFMSPLRDVLLGAIQIGDLHQTGKLFHAGQNRRFFGQ